MAKPVTPVIQTSARNVQSAAVEWRTDRSSPAVALDDEHRRAVDEQQAGDGAEEADRVPDRDGRAGGLDPDEGEAVVEDRRGQQAEEAPHRRGVEEPAATEPRLGGRIGVAVRPVPTLAERLDRQRRSTARSRTDAGRGGCRRRSAR